MVTTAKIVVKWCMRSGAALAIGLAVLWLTQAYLDQQRRREQIMAICADRGLDAVDLDYPHTPKCLDLVTGLMTVPRDLYKARGGRM